MRRIAFVAALFACASALCSAEGWRFDLGLGSVYGAEFTGSDRYFLLPLPAVEIRHETPSVDVFAGTLHGIGVEFESVDTGFYSSAGINLGDSRDPDLSNYVRGFALAGWTKLIFATEVEATYYPIFGAGRLYNGVCVDPRLAVALPLVGKTLVLSVSGGGSFMNGEYAEAWYDSGERFLGIRSVYGKANIVWRYVVPHVWMHAGYAIEGLEGDAARSARTRSSVSQKATFFVAYRFMK